MTLELFCCYLLRCDKARTHVAGAVRAAIGLLEAAEALPEE